MATSYNKKIVWEDEDVMVFLNPKDKRCYSGSGTALTNMAAGGDFSIFNEATVNDNYFSFDGSDDMVYGPSTNSVIGNSQKYFTLACWVRFTTGAGYIFNLKRTTSGSTLFGLQNYSSAGKIGLIFRNRGNTVHQWMNSSADYNDGNWHYLVGVSDDTTVSVYIDGSLESSNTAQGGVQLVDDSNTGYVSVGAFWAGSNPYAGDIALPILYKKALTADEISKNYFAMRSKFGV